jgi:aspartate-semialdehyde dehydrogenase
MTAGTLAVAVVGPSGLVGQEIIEILEARQLPVNEVRLLGSARTAGAEIERGGQTERVTLLDANSFDGLDLAFFAAGPSVAGAHAPVAAAAGTRVIDLSSRFRLDPAVPLIVPEVNAAAIHDGRERGIVASPSAIAIALAVVLAPLREAAGLRRVVVSTYQGTAGGGRTAVNRLSRETVELLAGRGSRRRIADRPRAFNCIPQVGAFVPGGATTQELQVVEEVRKTLAEPLLALSVTAVRVPTFFGYGLSVTCETDRPLAAAAATEVLRQAPGILVHDEPADPYPTPVEVVGSDGTHVGRIRADSAVERGLAFWIALDNVRKGAALNAVEIAEILARDLF